MTRGAVVALCAAVSAVAVVLLVGTGLGWWSSGPATPPAAQTLRVRTSLQPRPAFFGDVLVAEVDVSAGSASRIDVVPSFAPYAETGAPAVSRGRDGGLETVRYRYRIQCVSDNCLPVDKPFQLRLAPVVVTARAGGRTLTAKAAWPPTFVASRLASSDLAQARFRRPTTLPAPEYAVSPAVLADVLAALAGALALAAVALLSREVLRAFERRRRAVPLTPLESALAYTRASARRPEAADRRKALGLLSRTLNGEGASALAAQAGGVAWSDTAPTPEQALELAAEAETARRDGR